MNPLSYSHGSTHPPLFNQTIGAVFDATVARFPERLALVVHDQAVRWSWATLKANVDRHARALMALGIQPGDRVGIWASNRAEWCLTQFASAKVGAILVNINPAYRASEFEYALAQSGCSWLIAEAAFKSSDYHAMINQVLPELAATAPGTLCIERLPSLRGVISLGAEPPAGMLAWAALQQLAESVSDQALQARQAALQPSDPINIQYTSGTTGAPKGATLSHHNILNNGFLVGESLGLCEQDKVVIPVPLYHCFGMVMGNLGCMTHGSTMIYPCAAFDPLKVLEVVAAERATALYGVPTMFIAQLDHPRRAAFDLSSLRTGIMAGAACPVDVMQRVMEQMHMAQIQIAYGMTETSPVSLQTAAHDEVDKRVATVGKTQPHLQSKIVDASGAIVPRGEVGELCTRGYSVMLGYWGNPQATAEVLDGEGWMHTGDLATMDAQGYVSVVGRIKDMIIRGGENIYPGEIEAFYRGHPAVADIAIIGVPDPKYGEALVAWVRLHPAQHATQEALKLWARERIAHYKIPRDFTFVEAFPLTVTGKVQKFKMREITLQALKLG